MSDEDLRFALEAKDAQIAELIRTLLAVQFQLLHAEAELGRLRAV